MPSGTTSRAELKVLLADDHELIREALRSLLENQPGFKVIAEAPDGRTAVKLASDLSPDLVIMDINMPGLNGIEATRQLGAAANAPRVIALSGHSDRRFASEMLKAGAAGFVMKESAFEELLEAIESAMKGKVFISPGMSEGLAGESQAAKGVDAQSAFEVLSAREREVLQLTAEGKSTKQVALHLSISAKTVETHRRNLMQKLQIDSVAKLTKYAMREGITSG